MLARLLLEHRPAFARPTDRVFTSTPTYRTFISHCRAAGITIEDDRGRSIDRHACRKTFATWLEAAGVYGRTKSTLTRHAVRGNLADGTYTDTGLLDLRGAIERLPDLLSTPEPERLRATGTNNAQLEGVVPCVVPQGRELPRTTLNAEGSASKRSAKNHNKAAENRQRVKGVEPSTFTLAT